MDRDTFRFMKCLAYSVIIGFGLLMMLVILPGLLNAHKDGALMLIPLLLGSYAAAAFFTIRFIVHIELDMDQ